MDNQPTVLVVDDEDRFRHNLVKLLEANGIPTLDAANGPQAMEILEVHKVDVILLDLFMPVLGGKQTLVAMREKGYEQPVLVLTGHASVDAAVELLNLGALDYLLKPCNTERLLKRIKLATEGKTLKREPAAADTK